MLRNRLNSSSYYGKSIIINESIAKQSYKFVYLLGYAILIFMAIDYVFLLIPHQIFNPNWEFKTIGKIIETVPLTLLGFMLVFFRPQQQSVKQRELKVIAGLSWLALCLSIICFFFAPLLVTDALRINSMNQVKVNVQLDKQRSQVKQLELQVQGLSNEQVQNLWSKNNKNSDSNTILSIGEQKQQLVNKIKQKQASNRQKIQQNLRNTRRLLFRMALKWVLGTIVAGVYFIWIWKYTEWTRVVKAVEEGKL